MINDPVDAVIAAFLNHLESGEPEPSFDHLTDDERTEAMELIGLMADARGIDFYRSRPSLDALLAGSEFEHLLGRSATSDLGIDAIRADVVSSLGAGGELIADIAAEKDGILSNAVVRASGLRIRLQFRDDLESSAELAALDPRSTAGPVFGRFPETAAVVVVIGDQERSSVAIGPFEVHEFIGAPDGQLHEPRITGPVLSLPDTLRRLFDTLAPDLSGDTEVGDIVGSVDLSGIIRSECEAACRTVSAEGERARTDAKKEIWAGFDDTTLLIGLVEDAAAGHLSEAELEERLASAEAA